LATAVSALGRIFIRAIFIVRMRASLLKNFGFFRDDYLVFCRGRRSHSTFDYQSLLEFEREFYSNAAKIGVRFLLTITVYSDLSPPVKAAAGLHFKSNAYRPHTNKLIQPT
jgi:hypothetical protein